MTLRFLLSALLESQLASPRNPVIRNVLKVLADLAPLVIGMGLGLALIYAGAR